MNDPIDQAMSDRLSKLKVMPVDTSRAAARMEAQIGSLAKPESGRMRTLRPMRAVAASVLLLIALSAAFIVWSARPAVASAQVMAQMHEDLVSGRTPVTQVDSIDEASRQLAQQAQASDLPSLPNVPAEHVMACCMKSVKRKKVCCVLLKSAGGVPVTMAVANGEDMRLTSSSPTVERGGVTYRVESFNQLQMISAQREGRWVCLIGAVPADQLMDIAEKLEF
jgi:hypothetical protein